MFQGICTSSSHFVCSVSCIVFVSFSSNVFFFYNWSNIFHRFVCHVFVVADKSNVICILLVNYIVSCVVFVLFNVVIVVMKVFNGCY